MSLANAPFARSLQRLGSAPVGTKSRAALSLCDTEFGGLVDTCAPGRMQGGGE